MRQNLACTAHSAISIIAACRSDAIKTNPTVRGSCFFTLLAKMTSSGTLAPLEVLEPHIRRLWQSHLTDEQMLSELRKVFDTTQYGLG